MSYNIQTQVWTESETELSNWRQTSGKTRMGHREGDGLQCPQRRSGIHRKTARTKRNSLHQIQNWGKVQNVTRKIQRRERQTWQ